jgi:outer membrane scaffolding protein for murein synthesis (MipA/OmpV family)
VSSSDRRICLSRTSLFGLLALLLWPGNAAAQTFAPFPYWENAAGIVLAPLGGPLPEWRVNAEIGVAYMPYYEGSDHYRMMPAPAFDIRYKDIAFVSAGDGIGVNLIHGDLYRAGIALGYDVGRNAHLNGRLNGIGNVEPAAEPRLFVEYTIMPVVLSANIRHAIGGHDGLIGDVGAYMPVVGNEKVIVFVGPGLSFADQRYMQSYFGITPIQSAASTAHFPAYQVSGGFKTASFGLVGIYNLTDSWYLNGDLGVERLLGSAANSPIVQSRNQFGLTIALGYNF